MLSKKIEKVKKMAKGDPSGNTSGKRSLTSLFKLSLKALCSGLFHDGLTEDEFAKRNAIDFMLPQIFQKVENTGFATIREYVEDHFSGTNITAEDVIKRIREMEFVQSQKLFDQRDAYRLGKGLDRENDNYLPKKPKAERDSLTLAEKEEKRQDEIISIAESIYDNVGGVEDNRASFEKHVNGMLANPNIAGSIQQWGEITPAEVIAYNDSLTSNQKNTLSGRLEREIKEFEEQYPGF